MVDLLQFRKEFDEKFPGISKNVVKQLLKEQGIDSYSKPYTACRRYLEKGLSTKQFNLDALAVEYGLKPTVTKLRKKLTGVLAEQN